MQRHNLEILKASVEAKDKQAHHQAFYDENTTDNDDISANFENGGGRRNSRRRKKLLTAEEEAHLGTIYITYILHLCSCHHTKLTLQP